MNPNTTKSDHQLPPEDPNQSPPSTAAPAWGTWEELLLASAVNRYGTKSWDYISSELRKRSSDPIHITPHCCEQKYGELKRRFAKSDDNNSVMDNGGEITTNDVVPWLDELRKLRVLELERELRNYDLYIESLQTKVKRLTEEKSGKTDGDTAEKSDLGHGNHEIKFRPPEPAVSGDDDSDRENQSVNGSNGNLETGNGNGGTPVVLKPESVSEPDGGPGGEEPVKSKPDGSKSEGKNSDVQSSVSKLTNKRVPRGSSKLDEGEDEDECTDSVPVRSLPLVDFLHKIQKIGSVVFDHRLDRQEKVRYKNLIKQHIDYETLQTRLKQGWYSDGNNKFFRDLLLLVNNTRIFFPVRSPESIAAVELRQLVLTEMIMISKKKQKTSSNMPPKRPDSLLLKPELAAPIVVCRKRSSITAKAKTEQTDKIIEENPKKLGDSFSSGTKKKGKPPVNEGLDTKPEKNKKLTEAEEKKQSAAKFLNRMKQSNEPLLSMSKSTSERNSGGDGKKDQAGKKSSSGRQVNEQGSPAKRSVGRPPKRAAAVSGKRNRESMDTETLGSKQTKKRSKR